MKTSHPELAAELEIANSELIFRAEELVVAIKKLALQGDEKAERVAELENANREMGEFMHKLRHP